MPEILMGMEKLLSESYKPLNITLARERLPKEFHEGEKNK